MSLSKTAKKHLGQNFLIDENIKDRIIDAIIISDDDVILEIGPGLGALTQKMIDAGATIYAIEKDKEIIPKLRANVSSDHLHIIQADFLKYDLGQLPVITKVVGNIPYNISTPIIEKLIEHRDRFSEIFLSTQLEFAKRLTAKPGTKDYGSLTCFAQYFADMTILFKIGAQCFRPAPKVTSCFIKMLYRQHDPKANNEILLFEIIRTAFQQRRKKLANALAGIRDKNDVEMALNKLDLKEGVRADHISLDNYIMLSNYLDQ